MTVEKDTLLFNETHDVNEDNYNEEDSSSLHSSNLRSLVTTEKDAEELTSWKQIFHRAWSYLFTTNNNNEVVDSCTRPDRLEYDYVPPKESKLIQLRLKYDEKRCVRVPTFLLLVHSALNFVF